MNTPTERSAAVLLVGTQGIAPERDRPRAERLVNGDPQRTTWNVYANPTGEIFAGVWSSEVGSWRIEMGLSEDEFFFVVQGRCRLIGDGAAPVEAGPGQSLVIPAGFKGIFEVVEQMTKHYMIVDRKDSSL